MITLPMTVSSEAYSQFGYIYGTLPTAPSTIVVATQCDLPDVAFLSAATMLATAAWAPLAFIGAVVFSTGLSSPIEADIQSLCICCDSFSAACVFWLLGSAYSRGTFHRVRMLVPLVVCQLCTNIGDSNCRFFFGGNEEQAYWFFIVETFGRMGVVSFGCLLLAEGAGFLGGGCRSNSGHRHPHQVAAPGAAAGDEVTSSLSERAGASPGRRVWRSGRRRGALPTDSRTASAGFLFTLPFVLTYIAWHLDDHGAEQPFVKRCWWRSLKQEKVELVLYSAWLVLLFCFGAIIAIAQRRRRSRMLSVSASVMLSDGGDEAQASFVPIMIDDQRDHSRRCDDNLVDMTNENLVHSHQASSSAEGVFSSGGMSMLSLRTPAAPQEQPTPESSASSDSSCRSSRQVSGEDEEGRPTRGNSATTASPHTVLGAANGGALGGVGAAALSSWEEHRHMMMRPVDAERWTVQLLALLLVLAFLFVFLYLDCSHRCTHFLQFS